MPSRGEPGMGLVVGKTDEILSPILHTVSPLKEEERSA
jgi:hypothetical protein